MWKLSKEIKDIKRARFSGTFRRIEAVSEFTVHGLTVHKGEIGGWIEIDPTDPDHMYPIIDEISWVDYNSEVAYGCMLTNTLVVNSSVYPRIVGSNTWLDERTIKSILADSVVRDCQIWGGETR